MGRTRVQACRNPCPRSKHAPGDFLIKLMSAHCGRLLGAYRAEDWQHITAGLKVHRGICRGASLYWGRFLVSKRASKLILESRVRFFFSC